MINKESLTIEWLKQTSVIVHISTDNNGRYKFYGKFIANGYINHLFCITC
jgi:hypothetical protein